MIRKKYAMTDKVHIETYKNAYRNDFIRLNREWIETFFRIEASDIETFSHVDEIVEQGGQIFLAVTDHGEVAGCCALKHHRENESYELAKMAVSPLYQGHHIGHQLGMAVMEYAHRHGIRRIYLEGNTRLKASIALYRSLGFREIPLQDNAYERCDILMCWEDEQQNRMDNKHSAIVMGGTSGIGYEVALILARRGWRVGVAGRREEVLKKMMAETDGIVAYEVIDVNKPQAVDGLHSLIGKMGGMDLYFHSSGIGYQNVALDADKELSTIETNCLGMARLVGEAFRYLEQHPETDGQIAVISSIARTKGLGAAPAYSASKRFTSHYLECLCQLTSIRNIRNIHITDIRPGFVRTPLLQGSPFPMQLDARRVAESIVDGLEKRKSVITINWLYHLLVFFWQMIPRAIWIRMKIR